MNSTTLKTVFLWVAIFLMVIFLWRALNFDRTAVEEITYTEFLQKVEEGVVDSVTIKGRQEIHGEYTGAVADSKFKLLLPMEADSELLTRLEGNGIEVVGEKADENTLALILFQWAPILLIIALWIFFMRQMQSGGNKALSFGKSKARLLNPSGKKVTFKDVAGVEEAKEELSEIVEFLKEPQKFQKLGGRIPKGVLLMGPPGTGKTLLARAIAGEANVPFFSISGSDFVEMFVGVGASRVRDLFEQGKANAPCIIFIDEIDAVGRHRGAGLGGGHDEREQTLNQLLVEMDGFETNEGVILIAATNRPDVLDPALLRPGRFDRRVVVDRPDISGRLGILRVHVREIPLSDDVNLDVIARGTPGFAGADLANLVNEAALIAARRNRKLVRMEDFEYAKDKVLMGVERKAMMLTEEEKVITAFHEAGHALVAAFTEGSDPIHKVTIIPRGRALGVTMQLPSEDKYTYKQKYVMGRLAILMGGRVAEELTQDDVTTGAGNDIEQATSLARRMVCEWGMSQLGPLSLGGGKEEPVFLGREYAQRSDLSSETLKQVDAEISRLVDESYATATKILTDHRALLEELSHQLLERETLDGEEVYAMVEEATGEDRRPELPSLSDFSEDLEADGSDDQAEASDAEGSSSETTADAAEDGAAAAQAAAAAEESNDGEEASAPPPPGGDGDQAEAAEAVAAGKASGS
ncbi:MAG: ATP-dependent zinc metalloprotease FtsH [Acidobacteriota bacterium]